ncbi:MAG: Fe-only nitrogenase accessory AnfO family protein [Clostridia bacterium]
MEILKKIAVFCDEKGEVCTVYEAKKLMIYTYEQNWEITKNQSLFIDTITDMSALKKLAFELMEQLEDCKIVIGKGFTGVFFQFFSKEGYYIFETDGISPEILSDVYEEVFKVMAILEGKQQVPTSPVETEVPGYFAMDLMLLSKSHPDISSKMALVPFLDNEVFLELAIKCAHTPPWILKRDDLKIKELKSAKETLLIINKQDCFNV